MLTALKTLAKAFLDICLLRKGPQDLPRSSALLLVSAFAYACIDVLLTAQARSIPESLLVTLLDMCFLMAVSYLILRQHRVVDRWTQTMTALFGTGVILGLFIFPLVFGGGQIQYPDGLQQIILLLFLIMVVWNVAVLAHIVRNAISTSIGIGVLIAIFYIWMSSLLITMLFPGIAVQ